MAAEVHPRPRISSAPAAAEGEGEPASEVSLESPWLGLRAFNEGDRDYFFGRDAELAELFARVRANPFTVLYGRSGLGKTSLVRAGLVPKLREAGMYPVTVRLLHTEDAPELEQQVIDALAATRAAALREAVRRLSDAESSGHLFDGFPLWRLVHDPRMGLLSHVAPDLVLAFDQFEEIFTVGEEPSRRGRSRAFLRSLAEIVENRVPDPIRERLTAAKEGDLVSRVGDTLDYDSRRCRVVISMRDDYLHMLDRLRFEMPSVKENRFEIHLLTGRQAVAAVYGPGVLRKDMDKAKPEIVPNEVAEAIVRYVAQASTDVAIEDIGAVPPLLSLFCAELNKERIKQKREQITREDLIKGADEVLESFPERCYANLRPADRALSVRRFVEEELVSPQGFRATVNADQFIENQRFLFGPNQDDTAWSLLDQLVASRLLASVDRGGVHRVELTHDILTGPIVQSRDRSREAEKEEHRQKEQEELRVRAAEKAEQARRARRTIYVVGLTFLAVASVLGVFAATNAIRDSIERHATRIKVFSLQGQLAREAGRQLTQGDRAAWARISSLAYTMGQAADPLPEDLALATHRALEQFGAVQVTLTTGGLPIQQARFSSDGKRVVTMHARGTTLVWNGADGKLLATFRPPQGRTDVGSTVGPDDDAGSAATTDAGSAQPEPSNAKKMPSELVDARFVSNDGEVVTLDQDGVVRIWSAEPATLVDHFQCAGLGRALGVSDSGKVVAALCEKGLTFRRIDRVNGASQFKQSLQMEDTGVGATTQTVHPHSVFSARDTDKTVTTGVIQFVEGGDDAWVRANDQVTFWSLTKDTAQASRPVQTPTPGAVLGRDAHSFAFFDGSVGTVIDGATARCRFPAEPRKASQFDSDFRRLLSYGPGGFSVWDTSTCKPIGDSDASVDVAALALGGEAALTLNRGALELRSLQGLTTPGGKEGTQPGSRAWSLASTDRPISNFAVDREGARAIVWGATGTGWIIDLQVAAGARDWNIAHKGLYSMSPPTERVCAGRVENVSFAHLPDGTSMFAVGCAMGTAPVVEVRDAKFLRRGTCRHDSTSALSVALAPDGSVLATVGDDHVVGLHSIRPGALGTDGCASPMRRLRMDPKNRAAKALAFSHGGRLLATAGAFGRTCLWDALTGAARGCLQPTVDYERYVSAIAFSPDDAQLVTGDEAGGVFLFDLDSPGSFKEFHAHRARINSISFTADSHELLTASSDGEAILWSAAGSPISRLVHPGGVTDAQVGAGESTVLTGCDDGAVRLWDTSARPPTHVELTGHTAPVSGVELSAQGDVMSTSLDGTSRLWSRETGDAVVLHAGGGRVWSQRIVSGDLIVTVAAGGTIALWPTPPAEAVQSVHDRSNPIGGGALSSNDKHVALWDGDRAVLRRWDVDSRTEQATVGRGPAIFSSSGALYSASAEEAPLVDAPDQKTVRGACGQKVRAFAASHDSKQIIAVDEASHIELVEPRVKEEVHLQSDVQGGRINDIAIANDGSLLTASEDGTISAWSPVAPYSRLRVLDGGAGPLRRLSVSTDSIAAYGARRLVMFADTDAARPILDITEPWSIVAVGALPRGGGAIAASAAGRIYRIGPPAAYAPCSKESPCSKELWSIDLPPAGADDSTGSVGLLVDHHGETFVAFRETIETAAAVAPALYRVSDRMMLGALETEPVAHGTLAYDADDGTLLAVSESGILSVWDTPSVSSPGHMLTWPRWTRSSVTSATFAPNHRIVALLTDGSVQRLYAASGKHDTGAGAAMRWSPCNDSCSSAKDQACDDGRPGSPFSACDLGTDCTDCSVARGAFVPVNPSGDHAVFPSQPDKLLIVDLKDATVLNTKQVRPVGASRVVFGRNGDFYALMGDGTVDMRGLRESQVRRSLEYDRVESIAIEGSTSRALTVRSDGTLGVWDARTGAAVALEGLDPLPREVGLATLSRDGGRVAADQRTQGVAVFDVAARTYELRGGEINGFVSALALSDTGAFLVTGWPSGNVQLTEVATGISKVLSGFGGISGAAFSHDGAFLVVTSRSGTASVWTVPDGVPIDILRHPAGIRFATFGDGHHILTGGDEGFSELWDFEGEAPGSKLVTKLFDVTAKGAE